MSSSCCWRAYETKAEPKVIAPRIASKRAVAFWCSSILAGNTTSSTTTDASQWSQPIPSISSSVSQRRTSITFSVLRSLERKYRDQIPGAVCTIALKASLTGPWNWRDRLLMTPSDSSLAVQSIRITFRDASLMWGRYEMSWLSSSTMLAALLYISAACSMSSAPVSLKCEMWIVRNTIESTLIFSLVCCLKLPLFGA